jgi:folate-binding protein YgfZ
MMFSLDDYEALRHGAGIVDRGSRGRIRLTGTDRRSYLQGLLTNDIAALTPGTGCYAALLTPQGRMITDMHVVETGDAVLIDLPGSVRSRVFEQLEQFVFSEDVQVSDVTASMAQAGLYGPGAARALATAVDSASMLTATQLGEMLLESNVATASHEAQLLITRRDDFGVAGFDVFLDVERLATLQDALQSAGARAVDPEAVEACRIESGRPAFGVDMDADTIPLEAGIEDRAISFTKGCYVGQEIIIRVVHRGHGRVARRLVGLTFEPSAKVPVRGEVIQAVGRDLGSVTSAVRSPALGRPIALGYVHRDFAEPGTEVSAAGHGAVVTRLPFVSAPGA